HRRSMKNLNEISILLDRFIDGTDTSTIAANRLEILLDEAYPDDELIQERVVELASYVPGGGDHLFDRSQIQIRLARLRDYLRSRS
ncbi:hypothetical protein DLM19_24315, partial [Salmonella enterica subsp. enterica serovar Agona]|nr:hypothetical protein [Salmonella enterica subsp. enterica serovar Agona]